MLRRLLIDGDVLVYRFAHGEQIVTEWSNTLHTTHAFFDPARKKMDSYIDELLDTLEAEQYLVMLSDVDNSFRQGVWEDYKNTRAGVSRPVLFKPLRDHLLAEHEAIQEFTLEGDDLLGLYSDEKWEGDDDVENIICTIDKDLLTVPGHHYNIGVQDAKVISVSELDADFNFLTQTLVGDKTDGYPGCPGVGPVRAAKLLEEMLYAKDPLSYGWHRVTEAYNKAGVSRMALINARCARILRPGEYDFTTKEVKLWTPPA